jgi:type IV secretion system protein VirB9
MTADRLHFDWQTRGEKKLIPSRIFDDGNAVYLSWSKDTPLPAILTMAEDRKEGPLSYQMKGDYIVVSPIPQNLVLRYGSRMAQIWTTRRILQQPQPTAPVATPPAQIAQRMAPAPTPQAARPATQENTVKLANMTALFTDRVTDGRE